MLLVCPSFKAGLFQVQLFDTQAEITVSKVLSSTFPTWVMGCPMGQSQMVAVELMVPLHCKHICSVAIGVKRLPCFSKQGAALFQGFAIRAMCWVQPFSKSIK